MNAGSQRISGNQNIQVSGDGNTLNVSFGASAPAPAIDPAAAQALLDSMPLDEVPDVAALPTPHRMPLAANPRFVGRVGDLMRLAATLKAGRAAAITTGIGGVGKTQLASEFAHRYGQYFAGGVFWLSFADSAGVDTEIAACGGAGALGLYADADKLEIAEQVAKVYAAWEQSIPRLLIFDNCDDSEGGAAEKLLAARLPRSGGCRVLVTSRSGQWRDPRVATQALGTLSRAESIALLKTHRADLSDDEAGAIAELLGDLPLALSLAGGYLQTYAEEVIGKPATYLKNVEKVLLEHRSLQGAGAELSLTGHEQNVRATFEVSLKRLQPDDQVDAMALAALARAARLAPGEAFPRELLLATLGEATEDEEEIAQRADALRRLVGLGLLERAEEGALRMHRLLSAFALAAVADEGAQAAVERALTDIGNDLYSARLPKLLSPIASHIRNAVSLGGHRANVYTAALANTLGRLEEELTNYTAARVAYERALVIYEHVLGEQHTATASSLNNLALLLTQQGDYASARPLFERALVILEVALGPEAPETAQCLNNLACLLLYQGDNTSARPLFERALAIRERVLDPQNPALAESLNNLASVYNHGEDFATARLLYERALTIWEQSFGPEHPTVAGALKNLAELLSAQGDLSSARSLSERALVIQEQTLGPQHPDMAASLNTIASIVLKLGDVSSAEQYYKRALKILEHSLGPRHHKTAVNLWWIGRLLQQKGNLASARDYIAQALSIFTVTLGAEHPTTQKCQQQLAAIDRLASKQIGNIISDSQAMVAHALRDPGVDRTLLAHLLEARAQQAEQGQSSGSPYIKLAATLRALAARLGVGEGSG